MTQEGEIGLNIFLLLLFFSIGYCCRSYVCRSETNRELLTDLENEIEVLEERLSNQPQYREAIATAPQLTTAPPLAQAEPV